MIFILRFLLDDEEGFLTAGIWGGDDTFEHAHCKDKPKEDLFLSLLRLEQQTGYHQTFDVQLCNDAAGPIQTFDDPFLRALKLVVFLSLCHANSRELMQQLHFVGGRRGQQAQTRDSLHLPTTCTPSAWPSRVESRLKACKLSFLMQICGVVVRHCVSRLSLYAQRPTPYHKKWISS